MSPRSVSYRKAADADHYVYRAFDSYGLLLYIGCTVNVAKRIAQHRASSSWHRFAETIATTGPYRGRDEGRRVEREAIDAEASYFNASVADMTRTNANRVAAHQRVVTSGRYEPDCDLERAEADPAYAEQVDAEYHRWYRAREIERRRLKDSGLYPYLTDADRLARYLAAREDAERARIEVAA